MTDSMELILLALSSYLLSIRSLVWLECAIQPVIVSTMLDTCSILDTSWVLELSTSLIAFINYLNMSAELCGIRCDLIYIFHRYVLPFPG